MQAYQLATSSKSRILLLNFVSDATVQYMNSGGIGLLVMLLVRANRHGQRLLASGLNEHYREILHLTRLDEAIAVHDTPEAALESAA